MFGSVEVSVTFTSLIFNLANLNVMLQRLTATAQTIAFKDRRVCAFAHIQLAKMVRCLVWLPLWLSMCWCRKLAAFRLFP